MKTNSKYKKLASAAAVIDALGGNRAVADLFGVDYAVVWNWRARGLPSDTFAGMQRKLQQQRCYAPPDVWQQRAVVGE